jgi:hypothetical protein
MISPVFIPALSAAPEFTTDLTYAPLDTDQPYCCAFCEVTGTVVTPS